MNVYTFHRDWDESAKELVCAAAKKFQNRRTQHHEFWILSCYIDLDLLVECLSSLRRELRLTKVCLAFNFAEIFKRGPRATEEALHTIQDNLGDDIRIKWKALACSHLMHGKGYALIQKTDGKVTNGALLVTSANFTRPGFEGKNIEVGYLSTKSRDIRDFRRTYLTLWKEYGRAVNSSILKEERNLLEYALLSSGQFVHKWSGNLRRRLGIRYELTERAKEGTVPPELEAVGFEAGDTFTRQVIVLGDLPRKEIPSSFIRSYTIETYWGRWCPSDAWKTLSESFTSAETFIREFRKKTRRGVLNEMKLGVLEVQDNLVKRGLIKAVSEEHVENWAAKIKELRSDRRRLRRYFFGYDAHELPYQVEQRSDVNELFENLLEAIDFSKSKNVAMKKFQLALERGDVELIRLSSEEKESVRGMDRDV